MSEAAAIIIGAAISGVIGVLVVMTQQWLAHRHQVGTDRAMRLSGFGAAGWALSLALGRLAHAAAEQKAAVEERERLPELVDRFNACMAQIQLLEAGDLYLTAHRVDRSLADLVGAARQQQYTTEDWRARRTAVSDAVEAFQRAARAVLGSGASPAAASVPIRVATDQTRSRVSSCTGPGVCSGSCR